MSDDKKTTTASQPVTQAPIEKPKVDNESLSASKAVHKDAISNPQNIVRK